MKAWLTSFFSGLVFAIGLGIAGMTRPVKVIGFLDFFGRWDASLAFVMAGAIAVSFVAYRWSLTMRAPLLEPSFALPGRTDLDAKLIIGSAIFGAGWGLGGFCPGPALTSIASGALPVFAFVGAMVLGMYLHGWFAEMSAAAPGLTISTAKGTLDA